MRHIERLRVHATTVGHLTMLVGGTHNVNVTLVENPQVRNTEGVRHKVHTVDDTKAAGEKNLMLRNRVDDIFPPAGDNVLPDIRSDENRSDTNTPIADVASEFGKSRRGEIA